MGQASAAGTAEKPSAMYVAMRRVVKSVPKGKVATYGEVAEAAGFPRHSRHVAWSLKQFDPFLPWHRIIGRQSAHWGKVLLRGQPGVEQMQRLEAEGVRLRGVKVDMRVYGHFRRPSV